MGSDAKEIVRREGRSLELPSNRGLRFVMVAMSPYQSLPMHFKMKMMQNFESFADFRFWRARTVLDMHLIPTGSDNRFGQLWNRLDILIELFISPFFRSTSTR